MLNGINSMPSKYACIKFGHIIVTEGESLQTNLGSTDGAIIETKMYNLLGF